MPRKDEQVSDISDQGHIFGQLMREQTENTEETGNTSADDEFKPNSPADSEQ